MEDCNSDARAKKRNRAESGSGSDSPESKRARQNSGFDLGEIGVVGTEVSQLNLPESGGVDSEDSEFNSPGLLTIRHDILDILDDSDMVPDRVDPGIQDLDSVIKSFEEEILHPTPVPASDSGELGYLLEASDDELGLPPAMSSPSGELLNTQFADLAMIPSDALGENLGFENMVPNYDSFRYDEFSEEAEIQNNGVELFSNWEGSDFTELLWRQESLPAL